MTKKLMALLLAVLMAVSLLPMPALADGPTTITTLDPEQIAQGGSYVLDKNVTDITLTATAPTAHLTISKDVTIELTGQTVTFQLPEGGNYADSSVFRVTENGTWAPVSARQMAAIFAPLKNMTVLEQSVAIRSSLTEGQLAEIETLADALAEGVR